MKILVAGAGPAGLMFARTVGDEHQLTVLDTAAADDRPGQGITLFRAVADALGLETVDLPHISMHCDGSELSRLALPPRSGVARRHLITELRAACVDRGAQFEFAVSADAAVQRAGQFDLVLGADGAGSRVRQQHADAFGVTVLPQATTFAWLSAPVKVPGIRLVGRRSELGGFLMWLYPYSAEESTIIVQCTEATLARLRAAHAPSEQLEFLSRTFAPELEGAPIVGTGEEKWTNFRRVSAERGVHDKFALLGDAWHTFHFSMGLGTVVSIEDAVELAQALDDHPDDLHAALCAYEEARKPVHQHVRETTHHTMGLLDRALVALDRDDATSAAASLRDYGTFVNLPAWQ